MWSGRYHGEEIGSPRQLRYVLQNARKHEPHLAAGTPFVDRYSSAARFHGWTSHSAAAADAMRAAHLAHDIGRPVVAARTWLARVGWRRRGLLTRRRPPASVPQSPDGDGVTRDSRSLGLRGPDGVFTPVRMSTKADQEAVDPSVQKDPHDWTTGGERMTAPQRSYLHTLAQEAGLDPLDFDHLTKAEASLKIDELQQKTGRGAGATS